MVKYTVFLLLFIFCFQALAEEDDIAKFLENEIEKDFIESQRNQNDAGILEFRKAKIQLTDKFIAKTFDFQIDLNKSLKYKNYTIELNRCLETKYKGKMLQAAHMSILESNPGKQNIISKWLLTLSGHNFIGNRYVDVKLLNCEIDQE